METKSCYTCKIEKSLDCFRKVSGKPIGNCKVCEAYKSREWKKNNPERVQASINKHRSKNLAAKAERYQNDPDYREKLLRKARNRYRVNPIKKTLKAAELRAKSKGIPFDITIEDLHVPEVCPVLGLKLEVGDNLAKDCSASIDRIVPELGYVKGNVQIISNLANRMKSNATKEQLVLFAKWVLKEGE